VPSSHGGSHRFESYSAHHLFYGLAGFREKLPAALGQKISKQSAQVPELNPEQTIAAPQAVSNGAPQPEHGIDLGIGI
jgi:hypothetical protein